MNTSILAAVTRMCFFNLEVIMKKEDEGTISVVVPIYNQQKYLNISIPSILNQSYDKIEVLLVNDGSTDQSLEIIKKYANLDKRIKIIMIKNIF